MWTRCSAPSSFAPQAGADFLAVELTGGKEIHDDAILNGDLAASVFALGVLGSRDMAYVWQRIVEICGGTAPSPPAISACGFANTAMVLAEQHFVPRVWAAAIRVMSVARSLVAFEQGALGPNKDCAYEGPYIKAITGCPIALEGAEAACAHLSPIGNIAKAVADLWSNELVNNVKLLGAMAPDRLAGAAGLCHPADEHRRGARPGGGAAPCATGTPPPTPRSTRRPSCSARTWCWSLRPDRRRAHPLPAHPPRRPAPCWSACAGPARRAS